MTLEQLLPKDMPQQTFISGIKNPKNVHDSKQWKPCFAENLTSTGNQVNKVTSTVYPRDIYCNPQSSHQNEGSQTGPGGHGLTASNSKQFHLGNFRHDESHIC